MALLNGKIGLLLCGAFFIIFAVRILDGFSQSTRMEEGGLRRVENASDYPVGASASAGDARINTQRNKSENVIIIPATRQGHFETDVQIDHYRLPFLVDTGATIVVLRQSAADKIGLDVRQNDFTVDVSTANGMTRGASVRLGMIELDGFVIYDMAALVLPDNILQQNLLGMNALQEFGRVEFDAREIRLYPTRATQMALAKPAPPKVSPVKSVEPVAQTDMPLMPSGKADYRKRRAGKGELDKKKYTGYSD